jgi:hypothetical protein
MKRSCCRSMPRCASCPVRAAAASRGRHAGDDLAALLAEVLRGYPARPLPRSVAAALADLELARALRCASGQPGRLEQLGGGPVEIVERAVEALPGQ